MFHNPISDSGNTNLNSNDDDDDMDIYDYTNDHIFPVLFTWFKNIFYPLIPYL